MAAWTAEKMFFFIFLFSALFECDFSVRLGGVHSFGGRFLSFFQVTKYN